MLDEIVLDSHTERNTTPRDTQHLTIEPQIEFPMYVLDALEEDLERVDHQVLRPFRSSQFALPIQNRFAVLRQMGKSPLLRNPVSDGCG